MNELRMYVERLFEGKVLTAENIELKEEIYGNLVARYEDYVAGGMEPAEALEKTKASMTSIEGVLEGALDEVGEGVSAEGSAVAAEGAEKAEVAETPTQGDETYAGGASDPEIGAAASGSAAEVSANNPNEVGAGHLENGAAASPFAAPAMGPTGSPTPDMADTATIPPTTQPAAQSGVPPASPAINPYQVPTQTSSWAKGASFLSRHRRWVIAGVVALVVVLVAIAGVAAWVDAVYDDDYRAAANPSTNSQTGTSGTQSSGQQAGTSNSNSADSGTTSNNNNSQTAGNSGLGRAPSGYEIYYDANGNLWYGDNLADELLTAVVASTYADVAGFTGSTLSDTTSLSGLIRALPMGEWAGSVDVTRGTGVLAYTYTGVPKMYDGDSIDAAMAYATTAIFCAVAGVDTIQIAVSESDEPYDYDYYVFDRTIAESLYGTALTSDLVNEAGWTQLKDENLYTIHFIEAMVDRAEL